MPEVPLINGVNYSWANVTMVLFGVPVKGITKISWKKKQNKSNNYGHGQEPISRGYSNNEYEASIELYQDEFQKIVTASAGNPNAIPPFDVQLVFGGNRLNAMTKVLQQCEFMEDSFEANQGDSKLLVTVPLIIAGVLHL